MEGQNKKINKKQKLQKQKKSKNQKKIKKRRISRRGKKKTTDVIWCDSRRRWANKKLLSHKYLAGIAERRMLPILQP